MDNEKTPRESLCFQKPVLVYVPCYNCEHFVLDVLRQIPETVRGLIECLVLDNDSADQTARVVGEAVDAGEFTFPVTVLKTRKNLGYAGSQKLAYALAAGSPGVKKVIMLHGDGQYPPAHLNQFIDYFESDVAVVSGYRSKRSYRQKEETPLVTYMIIKLLSWMESALLGIRQKEWHSGFVMYDTDFLRKITLDELSTTMHIDGEFLICAHVLGEKTRGVPIYKRYKQFEALGGWKRVEHILNVFRVIVKYHRGFYHKLFSRRIGSKDFSGIYNVVRSR